MSTVRLETLQAIEKEAQAQWAAAKLTELDAPLPGEPAPAKFLTTFPFPYMNGKFHIGHGYSMTKCDFTSRFQRMQGKRSIWPFGFHVTGTPIAACAQKIIKEMELYGNPPVFPDDIIEQELAKKALNATEVLDLSKHKSKKGKAAPPMPQWQIMQSMGIPDDEIAAFADPQHWLDYFPPLAIEDLKSFGCHIDFRRSFMTTDRNPYFDRFVQWQFRQLRAKGLLDYGKRYCVYSPMDGQPCADHDRASGEGALPQEYTIVKLVVQRPTEQPAFASHAAVIGDRDVILPGATLRPETVVGQTNCWVGPSITYQAYAVTNKASKEEIYIMTPRAARNMSYQNFTVNGKTWCDPEPLFSVTGQAMVGLPLSAPLASYGTIYTLPMATITEGKGTGIVMSVPSDSPDDYINFIQLYNKEDYRRKLSLKDEWVMPFPPVPLINIPELGDECAKFMCEKLKINGPNAADLLEEAKKVCYQAGFYQGTMIIGPFTGKKVSEAKVLTQKVMEDADQCIRYYEPVRQVTSRSSDECVVALCDQWYIEYGKEEWRDVVLEHVAGMDMFSQGTKNAFVETLGWLADWPCSRTFGLGTLLPSDATHTMIIDSLSDSTIYMAYYMIARFFHTGPNGEHMLTGNPDNAYGLKPEMFTDEVFDYVYHARGEASAVAAAVSMPVESLNLMRGEFAYFYPVDIRTSGKDLIQNHLTMFLYNHAAIWPDQRELWPRTIFCNGQILINGEKMAKSKGNAITLTQAISSYGADPTRLACADAGDSLDDANFVIATAEGFILKLTTIIDQASETLNKTTTTGDDDTATHSPALRTGERNQFDHMFDNSINSTIRTTEMHYGHMHFRMVLNSAFHEFTNDFSQYKIYCDAQGMHRELVARFYETLTLLLMPLAPHFAEHMWQKVLGGTGTVMNQPFPAPTGLLNYSLVISQSVIVWVIRDVRMQATKHAKKRGPITEVCVYTAASYGAWQTKALELLHTIYRENDGALPQDLTKQVMAAKPEWMTKDIVPDTMAFLAYVKLNVERYGEQAMSLTPVLNDLDVLRSVQSTLQTLTGVPVVMLKASDDAEFPEHDVARRKCRPGEPTIAFPAAPKKE